MLDAAARKSVSVTDFKPKLGGNNWVSCVALDEYDTWMVCGCTHPSALPPCLALCSRHNTTRSHKQHEGVRRRHPFSEPVASAFADLQHGDAHRRHPASCSFQRQRGGSSHVQSPLSATRSPFYGTHDDTAQIVSVGNESKVYHWGKTNGILRSTAESKSSSLFSVAYNKEPVHLQVGVLLPL